MDPLGLCAAGGRQCRELRGPGCAARAMVRCAAAFFFFEWVGGRRGGGLHLRVLGFISLEFRVLGVRVNCSLNFLKGVIEWTI